MPTLTASPISRSRQTGPLAAGVPSRRRRSGAHTGVYWSSTAVVSVRMRKGLGMDGPPPPHGKPPEHYSGGRRRGERLEDPFPILIRGVNAQGDTFGRETVLDSFSAHEFAVRLPWRLLPGARVFAVVRLSLAPPAVPAPRVALRGLVLQVDRLRDGMYRTAVRIIRHRFF
jgi:hypothetical protein